MDLSIASILLLDGVTNGAIYALLGLATVLVFTVTRVIFIPQGEFVAYGALTLAILQTGKVPGTVWLLLILAGVAALMNAFGRVAAPPPGARVRSRRCCARWPFRWRWRWSRPGPRRASRTWRVQALLSVAVVTAYGPLVYRVAYQSLADASTLVLLIVSVGVHFAMTGLGLLFFGAEGYPQSRRSGTCASRSGPSTSRGQAIIIGFASLALIVLLWLFFERTLRGKALRATAVNRLGARLMGISPQSAGQTDVRDGGPDRRAFGPADRPDHHHLLRLGLPDRPEGLRRRRDGGALQLPGRAAGRAVRRH